MMVTTHRIYSGGVAKGENEPGTSSLAASLASLSWSVYWLICVSWQEKLSDLVGRSMEPNSRKQKTFLPKACRCTRFHWFYVQFVASILLPWNVSSHHMFHFVYRMGKILVVHFMGSISIFLLQKVQAMLPKPPLLINKHICPFLAKQVLPQKNVYLSCMHEFMSHMELN
jgi:hypothetical protein